MRKLFTLLFALLFAVTFTFAQDTPTPTADPVDVGWCSGDILAGANTNLNSTTILNTQLSPEIGYAITDNDLVTASFWINSTDDATSQMYQANYSRAVWFPGFYVGVGFAHTITDDTGQSAYSANAGYFRKLGKYWYVSPRIGFVSSEEVTNVLTQLTFGFVL